MSSKFKSLLKKFLPSSASTNKYYSDTVLEKLNENKRFYSDTLIEKLDENEKYYSDTVVKKLDESKISIDSDILSGKTSCSLNTDKNQSLPDLRDTKVSSI